MDGKSFDDLMRRALGAGSRRGIVRAVAATAIAPAFTRLLPQPEDEAEAKKKKKKKTTLCLNGQTIQASKKKKKKLLKQGATVGECPPPPPPPPPGTTTTTTTTTAAPQCLEAQESCPTGTCCGDLVCGDNFCEAPPVCCLEFGAACSETCDCCEQDSFCNDGTCDCFGIVCEGVCTGGDCCDSDDCPGTQICEEGICVCTSGFDCGAECCDAGVDEVCRFDPEPITCLGGGCPTYDYCNVSDLYTCGEFCDCVTSIEGANTCTDFSDLSCDVDCATDDECVTELGPGAICVPGGEFCDPCNGVEQNFCISGGCSPLRAAQGNSRAFRGKGAAAKSSAKSARTTSAARSKQERGGSKRRQKGGRR